MLTGKNDAITTLAAEIAAGASSCTVTDASKLPATFPYRLRIWDWATYRQPADDAGEIVEVTNAVGNVLTITRAQEAPLTYCTPLERPAPIPSHGPMWTRCKAP